MAKNAPIDSRIIDRVIAEIYEGWKVGDFTYGDAEVTAPRAIRRWQSYARRGIARADRDARIRDLARGIGGPYADSKLYRRAAERIAAVLDAEGFQ